MGQLLNLTFYIIGILFIVSAGFVNYKIIKYNQYLNLINLIIILYYIIGVFLIFRGDLILDIEGIAIFSPVFIYILTATIIIGRKECR